jgi:pterin-4a-carbinolamine dehydratase
LNISFLLFVTNYPSFILKVLSAHTFWTLNEEGHLVRRFVAKSFKAAMDFLNLAGEVAESVGHHPDFHLTSYRNVEVNLSMWRLIVDYRDR